MGHFRSRFGVVHILMAALALPVCILTDLFAQEPPTQPGVVPALPSTNVGGRGQDADPAQLNAGMAAFERNCTSCHDADRALNKSKDLASWRATVRRMANMRGANIPAEDVEPIATYLASRSGQTSGGMGGTDGKSESGSFSAFASLAPVFRGGRNELQNPGFFPDTWVGASWQGKVFSARVTACASCHGVHEEGLLSRVELVEAVVRVDLTAALDCCP